MPPVSHHPKPYLSKPGTQPCSPPHLSTAQPACLLLAPHGSTVYHRFLTCCCTPAHPPSPLFASPCRVCVCVPANGHRMGLQRAAGACGCPQPARRGLPTLAQPGWPGEEEEEGGPLLLAELPDQPGGRSLGRLLAPPQSQATTTRSTAASSSVGAYYKA